MCLPLDWLTLKKKKEQTIKYFYYMFITKAEHAGVPKKEELGYDGNDILKKYLTPIAEYGIVCSW